MSTACQSAARWSIINSLTVYGSFTRPGIALARCASPSATCCSSADHVLPEISPHQAPESIMPYTGLGHYLESLEKIGRMGGFDLALGGHQAPILDVYKRVTVIRQGHERKLEKILELIRRAPEPMTTDEISKQLYVHVRGFHVLLALEETAAHVEYLYHHGKLAIANLDQFQSEENPPIRYVEA